MDADDEIAKLKWLLVLGVLFLLSGCFSWREMKYSMFGKSADAALVRVYETTEYARRGRTVEKLAIDYQFEDKGAIRKETDSVAIDSPRPRGRTVPIEYLSGSPGSSRLKGHSNKVWMFVFLGCLAVMGYKVFRLVQESKR